MGIRVVGGVSKDGVGIHHEVVVLDGLEEQFETWCDGVRLISDHHPFFLEAYRCRCAKDRRGNLGNPV